MILHQVRTLNSTWLVQELMVSHERCADAPPASPARVESRYFEAMVAPDLAVCHAIKRHSSCETKIPASGFGRERTRKPEYHFFGNRLDRGRQVHVALRDRRIRFPRRSAEQLIELRVRHPQPTQ